MWKRILTAMIGLPGMILVSFLGGIWVSILLFIISCIGMYELYKATKMPNYIFALGFIGSFLIYFPETLQKFYLKIGNPIYFIILLSLLVAFFILQKKTKELAILIFSLIYIPFFLSFLMLLRKVENGIYYVWYALGSAFLTDTFAYFGGKKFGKNKLCKNISPNKTIEGAFLGIVGSTITVLAYSYIIKSIININIDFVCFGMILIASAIVSEIGDLVASIIKRKCEIKDFGNLLPGHGGILDRVDSLILVSPFIYTLLVHFKII